MPSRATAARLLISAGVNGGCLNSVSPVAHRVAGKLGRFRTTSGNLGQSRRISRLERIASQAMYSQPGSPRRASALQAWRSGSAISALAGAGNTEALSLASWGDMGRDGERWGDLQHRSALARVPAPYEGAPWQLPHLPISPHLSPHLPICGHSSQKQGPVRASDRRLAVHDRHAPMLASVLERVKLRDAP